MGILDAPGYSRSQAATKTQTGSVITRTVAGVGSTLVAPHYQSSDSPAPKRTRPNSTTYALDVDTISGASGNGYYGIFGASQADSTFEAVVSAASGYTGTGDDATFPNNGFQHIGIASRFTDSSNVAVIAMIAPASGEVQIADKVAGVEHAIYRNVVGITWNQKVRIRVVCSGTTITVTWWDYATGTQLDTTSYTRTVGAPSSGTFAFHAYSCSGSIYGNPGPRGWDGSNIPLFGGQGIWASNAAAAVTGGPKVTNGVIDLYSDGTNGSPNGWVNLLLPVQFDRFTLRGTLQLISGRMFGFDFFRDADNANGYLFCYDNNTPKISLKKGDADGNSEVKAWTVTAFPTATDLPFELVVRQDIYQLRINGQVFAYRDASYTGPGYVGLTGFGSRVQFRDLVWTPDPLTTLL